MDQARYDTIIVGAGPAGLSCAAILAEAGQRVLVLERGRRIGPKVCAGGITWSGLLRRVPGELIERTFSRQWIQTERQRFAIQERQPIIATVDRERLGRWLADKAMTAGARIISGEVARAITAATVITDRREIGYRFLVGADGSSSLVRRYLGIPSTHVGVGVQVMAAGHFPEMEWHLLPRFFGSGYGWIFPHQNRASIGAYAANGHVPAVRLRKNLLAWAEGRQLPLDGAKVQAAIINFDYRGWRFGNVFLVGDAAGLASALTGEGIYGALVSGEEVARVILDANYGCAPLYRLIAKGRQHRSLLRLVTGKAPLQKLVQECLALLLRRRLLHFSALEMGGLHED